MADSGNEIKPPLPEGVTSLMVRNPDGVTVSERLKNAKGQFVKKPKPLIPTVEFIRARRKRLAQVRESDGLTEDMAIVNELVEAMHIPILYDEKTGLPDSKMVMAKAKVAETLWLYTHGKPATSEQDLEKFTVQPFRVVYMENPEGVKPMEERPPEKKQPAFIDGVVIKQD